MGSHRYVRVCIDGKKIHATGGFNDEISKTISKVNLGDEYPGTKTGTIWSLIANGDHVVTYIFIKRRAKCRTRRVIEKVCEIHFSYGRAKRIIRSHPYVVVTKGSSDYNIGSFVDLANLLMSQEDISHGE